MQTIVIVGGGPRGVSVLERLIAILNSRKKLEEVRIVLVDKVQPGAGAIWETKQTRVLCMNTLANAVTLFTEPGSTISAPILPGPTLYEWIKATQYKSYPDDQDIVDRFAEELKEIRPESHPSRALYGEYIQWFYNRTKAKIPSYVKFEEKIATVERVERKDEYDVLYLNDGTTINSNATVIASGWERPAFNQEESKLNDEITKYNADKPEDKKLHWIEPNNPIEQNVEIIPAGENVIARGLGMGFFDFVSLVTIGREGKFIGDQTSIDLEYKPSGKEPKIFVSSGRGYPYLPKSLYDSLPPDSPLLRLKKVIQQINEEYPIEKDGWSKKLVDFTKQVFPAIIHDAYDAFYTTLWTFYPEKVHKPIEEIREIIDKQDALALYQGPTEELKSVADEHPDLDRYNLKKCQSIEELTQNVCDLIGKDLLESHLAYTSPQKSFLWAISCCRKPASILGVGRYSQESRRAIYSKLMNFGQMVGSGPPAFRTAQLRALIKAGIVKFLGGRPTIEIKENGFVAKSETTNNIEISSRYLVDAWMHRVDSRLSRPGLTKNLVEQGIGRPFPVRFESGEIVDSASLEVDPITRRLVRKDGAIDSRIHLIGIPTWSQMPDTTISPMPGTNPLMLQETDKAAVSAATIIGAW